MRLQGSLHRTRKMCALYSVSVMPRKFLKRSWERLVGEETAYKHLALPAHTTACQEPGAHKGPPVHPLLLLLNDCSLSRGFQVAHTKTAQSPAEVLKLRSWGVWISGRWMEGVSLLKVNNSLCFPHVAENFVGDIFFV